MQKTAFGKLNTTQISKITLENDFLRVVLCNFGATVMQIVVKNTKNGDVDVALGYDDVVDLQHDSQYIGSTVGRCANRINHGKFTLNGRQFHLHQNDGKNHLHGGKVGFNKRVFDILEAKHTSVKMHYFSPDGEENYCGNLDFFVEFSLIDSSFCINYVAKCDSDTLLNPTNHAYFNLNGHQNGSILDNMLTINSQKYLPIDKNLIPTGEICPTTQNPSAAKNQTSTQADQNSLAAKNQTSTQTDQNFLAAKNQASTQTDQNFLAAKNQASTQTDQNFIATKNTPNCMETPQNTANFDQNQEFPFDFSAPKPIGQHIFSPHPQIALAGGFDHSFCLKTSQNHQLIHAATALSPKTGIKMQVFTDREAIQFYSGNFLHGIKGKNGVIYNKHSAFCLETQCFPDAINHKNFPSPILKKDTQFSSQTIYKFTV